MKLKDIMIPLDRLCYCDKSVSIQYAAEIMSQSNVGSLLITNKEEQGQEKYIVKGIITKTDIVKSVALRYNLDDYTVGQIMQKEFVLCNEEDDRSQVAKKMVEQVVHHVIVINDRRQLVGIATTFDIAKDIYADSNDPFPYLRRFFGIPETTIEETTEKLEKSLEHGVSKFKNVIPPSFPKIYVPKQI
jgi:CBS domain-containing protein